jgi:hypothetical protein
MGESVDFGAITNYRRAPAMPLFQSSIVIIFAAYDYTELYHLEY